MKYLTLMTLVFAASIAQADFWDNCTAYGGTIVTANSYGNDKGGLCNDPSDPNLTNNCNGKRFCRSGNAMNWWSAFTWCESVGGKLASFEVLCPGVQKNNSGTCPNLKSVGGSNDWCLSTLGWEKTQNIVVSLTGSVSYSNRTQLHYGSYSFNALCEE